MVDAGRKLRIVMGDVEQSLVRTADAAGESQIRPLRQSFDTEDSHPFAAPCQLFRTGVQAKADRVEKAAGDDVQRREVFPISPVHFRADIADMTLNFPDALTRPAGMPEKGDLAGVCLRIVGADQGQEGGLAGAVFSADGPMFPFPDNPTEANGASRPKLCSRQRSAWKALAFSNASTAMSGF